MSETTNHLDEWVMGLADNGEFWKQDTAFVLTQNVLELLQYGVPLEAAKHCVESVYFATRSEYGD